VLAGNDRPLRDVHPNLTGPNGWVAKWRNHGDREPVDAVRRFLRQRDISSFDSTVPHDTRAKATMVNEAKSPGDEVFDDLLEWMGSPFMFAARDIRAAAASAHAPDDAQLMYRNENVSFERQLVQYMRRRTRRPLWMPHKHLGWEGKLVAIRELIPHRTGERDGRLEYKRCQDTLKSLTAGKKVSPEYLKLVDEDGQV